jgi:predicted permease
MIIAGLTVTTIFGVARVSARLAGFGNRLAPTFTQSAFHGNLGLIGLAVVALALSDRSFAFAAVLAGWLILLQNLLAVWNLRDRMPPSQSPGAFPRVLANPIILSCLAGCTASALALDVNWLLDATLDMLAGLAVPLALLVIGASLRVVVSRGRRLVVLAACALKLVVMPAIAVILFTMAGLPATSRTGLVVLLASPTALTVHTMAEEVGADTDFAAAAISTSTLLSGITLSGWLTIL